MRLITSFKTVNQPLSGSLGDVAEYDVARLDVLQLDLENTGSAALTGFSVLARVSQDAPYRDVTPASFIVESDIVFAPARVAPGTLAAADWAMLGLNVTAYQSVKLRAVGASAVLRATAGGYEVAS